MPATKNLCAQIPTDLHQRVCKAREQSGLTTAEYITNLLIEYYEMKENGGKQIMAANGTRTMAFQIPEDLFQRIKAHLERETARTGKKLTQREFVLGLIEEALNEAGVSPCEAPENGSDPQAPGGGRTGPVGRGKARIRPPSTTTTKQQMRGPQSIPNSGMLWGLLFVSPEGGDQDKAQPQPSASQMRRWISPRGQTCRICWNTWATG